MMIACPRCWNAIRPCDRCGSTGQIPDVQLGPNFALGELVHSAKALELKLPNDPTAYDFLHLRELVTSLLQPMRNALGPLHVSSGYRSPQVNAAIGGEKTSAHVVGYAADLEPGSRSLEEVMAWLRDSELKFDQAILEPGWVHVGLKRPGSGQQRRELLRKVGTRYPAWEA